MLRRRGAGRVGLVSVVVLMSAGCLDADIEITVNDDGSGAVFEEIALDPDKALELLGPLAEGFGEEAGFDRDTLCTDFLSDERQDVPDGATVEEFEEGGKCGLRINATFDASDDPGAMVDQILGSDDGLAPILRREPSGGWRFETPVDTSAVDSGTGDDAIPPELLADLQESFDVNFTVRLPGRPVEHNATSVDGNTFTWHIDFANPPDRLFAVTEPGDPGSGGGSALRWILLGLAGAVLLGTLLYWLSTRRRPATATAARASGQNAPVWDPVRNAWTVTDATGRALVHDPITGQWRDQ